MRDRVSTIFALRLGVLGVSALVLLLLGGCEKNPVDSDIQQGLRRIDQQPAWSPDGHTLVYYHAQLLDSTEQWDPDTSGLYLINADGRGKRLLLVGLTHFPDWSPDGQWIVFEQGAQIHKIMANGDSLTQLTSQGRNFFPSWSPDGEWIVYDSDIDNPNKNYFVWKATPDGARQERITYAPEEGSIRMPSWSPDGSKIVHTRFFDGLWSSKIVIMDFGGANVTRVTSRKSTDRYPRFSPNGRKILFLSQPYASAFQLYVIDSSGDHLRQLTEQGAWAGDWSPDGQTIVFTNRVDGRLWTMDAGGANWRQLTFEP